MPFVVLQDRGFAEGEGAFCLRYVLSTIAKRIVRHSAQQSALRPLFGTVLFWKWLSVLAKIFFAEIIIIEFQVDLSQNGSRISSG